MRKGAKLVLGLTLAITLAASLWPTVRRCREETEPTYVTAPLSIWVEMLATTADRTVSQAGAYNSSIAAVRHVGTNGIPCLLRWITYEAPAWNLRAQGVLPKIPILGKSRAVLLKLQKSTHRAEGAKFSFKVLGPAALSAIPELSRIAADKNKPVASARARAALLGLAYETVLHGHTSQYPAVLPILREAAATNSTASDLANEALANVGTNCPTP